jgi:hypothetical protein
MDQIRDTQKVGHSLTAWVEGLREDEPDIVAIDGKTSRRAGGANGILCMSSQPGPRASDWFWGKRRLTQNQMKSALYLCFSNGST